MEDGNRKELDKTNFGMESKEVLYRWINLSFNG